MILEYTVFAGQMRLWSEEDVVRAAVAQDAAAGFREAEASMQPLPTKRYPKPMKQGTYINILYL